MAVVFESKYGTPIEQNSWKWFSDKKFWFYRFGLLGLNCHQLLWKEVNVKILKNNLYLSDSNLADGKENSAKTKRKRKQKISVSPRSEINGSRYR